MKAEIDELARLLRTSQKVIFDLESKMEKASGRKGIIKRIVQENEKRVKRAIANLEFDNRKEPLNYKAEQIFQALIKKAERNDHLLFEHFKEPDFSSASGCRSLINATKELTNNLTGFYLKEEKARELLYLNPPKQIMSNLGYGDDVKKMLDKEDVFEIFCALRFVEDENWLNNTFLRAYQRLKSDDFGKRQIKVMVLPERWTGIGQKFLGKKLHHMSHLKELGIVFVIPVAETRPGETLYLFFMTLHYIYEIDWHARLFERYSQEKNFAEKMINALRVEVGNQVLPDEEKMSWRIVPKYLAKKDVNDPRLAEPHISPEAWHYTKAALAIQKFAQRFPEIELEFWRGLDVVGSYFPMDGSKEEKLVSFDLFDNGISLLQKAGFESKYLYHQQEALWNEIFIEYMGEEAFDKLMMENLDKGFIQL